MAELNEVVKARIDVGADDTESSFEDEDFDIIPILERNVRKILHQLKHEQVGLCRQLPSPLPAVCVCVCAVSYTHLTLPTSSEV